MFTFQYGRTDSGKETRRKSPSIVLLHQVNSHPMSMLSGLPASALNMLLARIEVCG